jgi:hypothetical protein
VFGAGASNSAGAAPVATGAAGAAGAGGAAAAPDPAGAASAASTGGALPLRELAPQELGAARRAATPRARPLGQGRSKAAHVSKMLTGLVESSKENMCLQEKLAKQRIGAAKQGLKYLASSVRAAMATGATINAVAAAAISKGDDVAAALRTNLDLVREVCDVVDMTGLTDSDNDEDVRVVGEAGLCSAAPAQPQVKVRRSCARRSRVHCAAARAAPAEREVSTTPTLGTTARAAAAGCEASPTPTPAPDVAETEAAGGASPAADGMPPPSPTLGGEDSVAAPALEA